MEIVPSLGLAAFLFVLGLCFVVAEVMVPSFGLLTALSVISFVASFIVAFRLSMAAGVIFVILAAFLIPVLIVFGFRRFPSSRVGRKLILSSTGKGSKGQPADEEKLEDLLGKEGIARSKLRPGGIAEFGSRRVSVTSESSFIEPGARIKALRVEANRVVVRALDTHRQEEEV